MRDEVISDWLYKTEWSGWVREPIAGDASSRRYQRLRSAGKTVILMIAPPDICGSLMPFISIARHLKSAGLAAPTIYTSDEVLGLMVLEDLGEIDFASWLNAHPQDEIRLYTAASDVLLKLHECPLPDGLKVLTPKAGAEMIGPVFEWYAPDCPKALAEEITRKIEELLSEPCAQPLVLSLRDYHAENLIWRPCLGGIERVGLLDFQDAFSAPAAYDLASLLRDARRDVSEDAVQQTLASFAEKSSTPARALEHAFAILSVQRNLRILGIFARLAKRDSKHGYLRLVPRVRKHIETDITHPCMSALAPLIRKAFGDRGAA